MLGVPRIGRGDALALGALAATALVIAVPILRGAYSTYIDNSVHLAELWELSQPDCPAWSELGFGGFPLGTLHSPLWYPLLAFAVRHGAPLEGLYCTALLVGFVAPSVALYFVARRRLEPFPSALLAYLMLVQPAAIWGIGSPLGGMWTHALSTAGLVLLADLYARPMLGRGQHWVAAVLLALSVLTHLFVIPLATLVFASSVVVLHVRKKLASPELGKRLVALVAAAAASAQYWLMLVMVGNEAKAPHQAFAPPELFARLLLPADAMFLIDADARGSIRTDLYLTDAVPILSLFVLGIAGFVLSRRQKDDDLGAIGFLFGVGLFVLLFLHHYVRLPIFGPVSFRLIEGVRVGMALSAIPALSALSRRPWLRAPRAALAVPLAGLGVLSGLWWGIPLDNDNQEDANAAVREVRDLGVWLREHRSPDWGRIYLQDTFGYEWRNGGIRLTHVPVLAMRDSRLPQLGTYYGVVPFQLRWTSSEFNTLYGMWNPTEEWLHEAMEKTNAGILVTSNAWMARHVGDLESFDALARIGRYTVFRREGGKNLPVAELTPANHVGEVRAGHDRLEFPLVTEYPRTRVLVKTSWHPFWHLDGVPGASLRESPEGFLVLDAIPDGQFQVRLRYSESRIPLLVTLAGWVALGLSGAALALTRRRASRAAGSPA